MNKETPLQLFAIRLFALLLIAGGVGAIVKMVYCLFTGSIDIDFGFLGLVIGKGLLDRRELWRKWAVFVAWIGIITTPLIAVLFVWVGAEADWTIAGIQAYPSPSLFLIAPMLAGFFLFSLWQQWVLTRPSVKESFSPKGERSNWWLPIAIVLFVLCSVDAIEESFHESMIDRFAHSIQHCEATIEAFDAKTGTRLSPIIHGPSVRADQVFPKMCFTGMDHGIEVSGIGIPPLEVGVSADGYQEKKITLEPAEKHGKLRVKLERIAGEMKGTEGNKGR